MIRRGASALLCGGIRLYQIALRPVLKAVAGPSAGCRFQPTCSRYALEAIALHGPWRGTWLAICRIFRCHPWGGSGYDPVPPGARSGCKCRKPR